MKPFFLCWLFIVYAIIGCKTMKQSQSEHSNVKATSESSTRTIKAKALLQQVSNTRLDTSTSNTESDYEIESFSLKYPVLDSSGKNVGDAVYTVTKEKGKKNTKKSKASKQRTGKTTDITENEKIADKDKLAVNIVDTSKQVNKTTTGGWSLKIGVIIGIVLFLLIVIIKRKLKTLPFLCIAMLLFALSCEQKVETPTVAPLEITQQHTPAKLTLLDIACKEIGTKEIPKGSNWGGDIPKYLESVGIKYPAPWCMAYTYWVVDQYYQQQGKPNPLYKTGHVLTQWRKCKLLRFKNPKPGDIFIILNLDSKGNPDGTGHCGFVYHVTENKVYTIEGNTNTDGSHNGYMVCRQINGRLKTTITGYIRVLKE